MFCHLETALIDHFGQMTHDGNAFEDREVMPNVKKIGSITMNGNIIAAGMMLIELGMARTP